MKTSLFHNRRLILILSCLLALLFTACPKTRDEVIEERRQETIAKAEAIWASADMLKPGMTESEVIEIVGEKNWGGFMNAGTVNGINKTVMSYPGGQYLVIEWRYEGDAAAIQQLPIYHDPDEDPNLDAALLRTFETIRLSEEPF